MARPVPPTASSRHFLLIGISAASLLADPGHGHAQAEPAPPAAAKRTLAPAAAQGVEEVVVSAQHRKQNSQRVPISIQSFSAKDLAALSVFQLQDIQKAAPSVSFGDGSEQGRYGVRGIIDYSRNAGYDSRVGVYVDGVYLGRSYMNNQLLLGTQQIDVLSGPQGTLFGKNTDAGVIAITNQKPTSDYHAEFDGDGGTYGFGKVAGLVNVPVYGSKVDVQIGVAKIFGGDYYENTELHEGNEGVNGIASRGQVRIRPNDDLDINLSVDDLHELNSTLHYTYRTPPGQDVYDFNSYNNDYGERDSYGTAADIEYRLPYGYQLSSITAFRGGGQRLFFNNETGPTPVETSLQTEVTHQTSEELRIASPRTARYDFVAGIYYFNQVNSDQSDAFFGPGITEVSPLLKQEANTSHPYGANVETNSIAGFGNGDYRITPAIELTGGLRYTYEAKDLNDLYETDPLRLLLANVSGYKATLSTYKLTPKGGINVHLTPTSMLYGSVGRGFKSGGFNADALSVAQLAAGIRVAPETATSFEVGLKNDFLNHRLRINVDAFLEHFDNFQVFTFVPVVVGNAVVQSSSLTNAGQVTSKGGELEASYVVLHGLRASLNGIYDNSYFNSYAGGGGTAFGQTISGAGEQTPYAPQLKFYAALDYTHPLIRQADWFGHLGYSRQTSENFDPKVANPIYGFAYRIPAYDEVDARIGLSATNKGWQASLWAKNLLNNVHIIFANRTAVLGNPAVLYAAPRTFGGSLKLLF